MWGLRAEGQFNPNLLAACDSYHANSDKVGLFERRILQNICYHVYGCMNYLRIEGGD